MSELAGRSSIQLKAEQLGIELDGKQAGEVADRLKDLEHKGFHFEAADGSMELLIRDVTGWTQPYFELESLRVIHDETDDADSRTEATVKLIVDGVREIRTAEGNGPVNAIDRALRDAIGARHPQLAKMHLTDYKVRVLDTSKGTGAVTRVLIDATDGDRSWTTIGVSENIIEASWQALRDSLVYGLLHTA
jgi:2-isopropylmalate synthase